MNAVGDIVQRRPFVFMVMFATALLCAVGPTFAQGFQAKLIGRWRIDWKRTAELGEKSAAEAKQAQEQAVTDVTYNFAQDGALPIKARVNMEAVEVSGGTWKLMKENTKQKQLELEVTQQGRAYNVTLEFLSADEIKMVGEKTSPLPPLVLTRVK